MIAPCQGANIAIDGKGYHQANVLLPLHIKAEWFCKNHIKNRTCFMYLCQRFVCNSSKKRRLYWTTESSKDLLFQIENTFPTHSLMV